MKGRYPIAFALGAVLLFASFPVPAVETTIFVNKYFEVRDHDQPTKYVFNGSTRVARITSSLSTNTRIQRFRLHPGWNLLSLAVSATNLSDQLQSPGVVASIHSWNAPTGSYIPVPQVASSGMVLWVNATTNATLSVVGAYSDPVNREVPAGATYLSGTGLEAWTPNFPTTLSVWHFSPQPVDGALAPFSPWRSRLAGNLSAVNDLPEAFPPGQALYVINQAPFELEVPDPALRIRYYHQDHLGSSSVMTDAGGALVEETAFYPFGVPRHEHRLRQVEEAYKFTQKERDRESGLHHFEARYLAGAMSRFLSVDPMYANIDSSADDPQALNLYAYVRNNPLVYTDPTGLDRYSEIAHQAAVQDTKAAQAEGGGFLNGVATAVTGFCDAALGCGMGGYQVTRSIVVEAHKVDTDSKVYTGFHIAGIVATAFIPSPIKGPVAAPGTVTLWSKTPIAPILMPRPPVPGTRTSASTPGTGVGAAEPSIVVAPQAYIPDGRTVLKTGTEAQKWYHARLGELSQERNAMTLEQLGASTRAVYQEMVRRFGRD